MPICLKSVTSSVRSFISCSSFSSLASRFSFLLSSPFFIQPLEYGEILFDTVNFLCIYFLLYFGRLGYFSKLVVCQDDAVPVVVLDVMEYSDTLLRRKVLLTRIQYSGIRIGPLERVGYVMHIAFESDNHRFVRQSETFHLKGGHTHDKGLAGSYNSNIVKHTAIELRGKEESPLIAVGKQARLGLLHHGYNVVREWEGFSEKPTYEAAEEIADYAASMRSGRSGPHLYVL